MAKRDAPHQARHHAAVDRVVDALRQLPFVVAIGAYGSTATHTWTDHSDIDLVAVTDIDPPVESLRFFVDGLAVDLNIRARDHGEHGLGGAAFMPETAPVWDPTNVFATSRPTGRVHNSAAGDAVRYMLFHDAQKLRQIDDPLLRRLAMGQVVEQVLQAWYQARNEPFPGEVTSVYDLQQREPSMVALLDQAMVASRVDLLMEAAEIASAPIGGVFAAGDVLALSWARPSVEPVPPAFRDFVDHVADRHPERQ